ncbi:MAG: AAA family ATPase [Fusobacteriaceae bacterium]
MLKSLEIKGYKSIDELKIEFKKLNLLVGGNSVGKSSIIQALLIFSQDITEKNEKISGDFISFSNYREIKNKQKTRKNIELKIELENVDCLKEITEEESDGEIKINTLCLNCDKKIECQKNNFYLDYKSHFNYLCADRVGNLEIYDRNVLSKTKVGIFGEYAIDYLVNNKNNKVEDSIIRYIEDKTLGGQVDYWLKYITGYEVKVGKIEHTDKVMAYYQKNGISYRGKNVGAGLGYLLSIIILCLSSDGENIIVIENPEIHLHPKAQSLLCEFLVFIAKQGTQIILETHSDHIFNGTRVAIYEKRINKEDVSINYLELSVDGITEKNVVDLNEQGRILNQRLGIFEQFDLDIDRLLGLE